MPEPADAEVVKKAGRSACCIQALQIASRWAKPLSVIQGKIVCVAGGQAVWSKRVRQLWARCAS